MNKYLKKKAVLHVVAIKETSREQDLSLALKKKPKQKTGGRQQMSLCLQVLQRLLALQHFFFVGSAARVKAELLIASPVSHPPL